MIDHEEGRIRLDKWLWAARFFKTRALAAEAVEGGKVQVNGDRPKRARPVQVGDEVRVRLGPYEHTVSVRALSGRRGPASEAAGLYEETVESRTQARGAGDPAQVAARRLRSRQGAADEKGPEGDPEIEGETLRKT